MLQPTLVLCSHLPWRRCFSPQLMLTEALPGTETPLRMIEEGENLTGICNVDVYKSGFWYSGSSVYSTPPFSALQRPSLGCLCISIPQCTNPRKAVSLARTWAENEGRRCRFSQRGSLSAPTVTVDPALGATCWPHSAPLRPAYWTEGERMQLRYSIQDALQWSCGHVCMTGPPVIRSG